MVIDLWWQNDMAIKKLSCPLMDTEIDEGICYDIHMNVETILTARIGEAGKRLHTARSRNDQCQVDGRLYVRKEIG